MALRAIALSASAIGALEYQGTWDASANSPTITSSVGTKGAYYVVSVAGTTSIDGISNWGVGDWIVFNGSVWQRVEGGADLNGVNLTFTGTASGPGYQLSAAGIITESGTTRTLSATDNGKVIYCTSGSAVTITCAAGLGAGFSTTIIQAGAGKVTVAAGGQTLVSYSSLFSTMGQYAVISLVCPVADTFVAAGNLGV
jgi:hypothetical protein